MRLKTIVTTVCVGLMLSIMSVSLFPGTARSCTEDPRTRLRVVNPLTGKTFFIDIVGAANEQAVRQKVFEKMQRDLDASTRSMLGSALNHWSDNGPSVGAPANQALGRSLGATGR